MNVNIILTGIIIGLLVIVGVAGYTYITQPNEAYITPQLEGNTIAHQIAARNIPVLIEQLGTDGNGYEVRGQTRWYGNGSIIIVLDADVDPTSYDASAILAHELGHIVYNGGTEAQADDYAASLGYSITDAYHGIH
jgi:hypothetical protein